MQPISGFAIDRSEVSIGQFRRYAEAEAYCRWAGKRLPSDREWVEAAYTERRSTAPAPFIWRVNHRKRRSCTSGSAA